MIAPLVPLVDYQNVYNGAGGYFHSRLDPGWAGARWVRWSWGCSSRHEASVTGSCR